MPIAVPQDPVLPDELPPLPEEPTTEAIAPIVADDYYRKIPIAPIANPGFYPTQQILTVEPSIGGQLSLAHHELGRLDTYSDVFLENGLAIAESMPAIGVEKPQLAIAKPHFTAIGRPIAVENRQPAFLTDIDRRVEDETVSNRVWDIEAQRNQEFRQYLGVTTNLPDRSILIANFQNILNTIEEATGKRLGIIYAIARKDELELILVPAVGHPIRYRVPEAPKEKLLSVSKDFREQITNPRRLYTTTYLPSAKQLYQWLIEPLRSDLERLEISTLMLSLDPGLRSLPIAAFHDGEKFLIEQYSFSLIPSFSLTTHSYESIQNARVLAMGASTFPDKNPLPAVPVELGAISKQLGVGKSFLNEDFTLNNLVQQRLAERFNIIHLATHAEFLPGLPSNSYIQLWDDQLQLSEMSSLDWNDPPVELLVLSACRTALGNQEAELGFGGLAVQSGVKTAVASLWYVNDKGTLGLMTNFYYHLRKSSLKSEALRQAQIDMIRGNVRIENGTLISGQGAVALSLELAQTNNALFSHPYYWSAFTAIGSPW